MPVSASTLAKLMAAGLSGQDLIDVVASIDADMETSAPIKSRSAGAIRQERYRNRKASQSVTSDVTRDVTEGNAALPPSPGPLDPPSQTLPPIIPQTPSTIPVKKRASRLPADWVLPATWGRWALDQGHSEAKVRLEADKFRDFWVSKGGKDAAKLDWEATWRNWIRNCSGSRGPPPAIGDDGLARDAQGRVNMADFTSKILEQARQLEDDPNGRTIETSYERGTGNRAQQALPLPRTEER